LGRACPHRAADPVLTGHSIRPLEVDDVERYEVRDGSARRKEEVVLRLLRGETLDALARETGQAAGVISPWREEFLQGGHAGLKSRPAPSEDRRLADAQRKIGELAMDLNIAKALLDEVDRRPQSPRR
jgi:transposase